MTVELPKRDSNKPHQSRFLFPATNDKGERVMVLMERDAPFHGNQGFEALARFIKQFPPTAEQAAAAREGDMRLARAAEAERLAKLKEKKR